VNLVSADRRWAGRLAIVAATGPSLTPDIIEQCRGHIVLAVNDAMRVMPWADAGYACDASWWDVHKGCHDLQGQRWTSHSLNPQNDKSKIADKYPLHIIRGEGKPGFSLDPDVIHYGNNSGYQAVNLAILFGADPIVLVGFDMHRVEDKNHFFGNHPSPLRNANTYSQWVKNFIVAAELLGRRPRILNATPGSALTCFPMVGLVSALQEKVAA
jgi:hypothetical protein